jgi:hypothetical protein
MRSKAKDMAYKRKAKKKDDLRKNPDKIDTSMGRYYLKMGRVVVLENRFYDNSNYHLFKR